MNQNCSKCDTKIADERFHLGYKECVECSSIEPYSAHVVYPHKTGAYVQPVSSETKKNLDRLDRRAVKVGGKMSAPNVKEWTMPEPKPISKNLYTTKDKFITIIKHFLNVSKVVLILISIKVIG